MSRIYSFALLVASVSFLASTAAAALEVDTLTVPVDFAIDGYGPISHDITLPRAVSLDGVTLVGIEAFTAQFDASAEAGDSDELRGGISIASSEDGGLALAAIGPGIFYRFGRSAFGFTYRDTSELSGQDGLSVDILRFDLTLTGARSGGRRGRLRGLHEGHVRLHFYRGDLDGNSASETHQRRPLFGLSRIEQNGPGASPWQTVEFDMPVLVDGLRTVLQGPQFVWSNSGGPVDSMVEAVLVLDDGREIALDDANAPSTGEPAAGRGSNSNSLVLEDWRAYEGAEIEAYRWRARRAGNGTVWFDPSMLGAPTLYFGYEICPDALDCNENGLADCYEADCDANGVPDDCDIASGSSSDVDENGVPDSCEPDCNANDVPDAFELSEDPTADCNGNAVPDDCDIASGTSDDINVNALPDECEQGLEVTPELLDFGEVRIGEPRMLELSIRNTGAVTINVTSVGLVGLGSSDFSIASVPADLDLAPDDVFTVAVTFAPDSEGPAEKQLLIASSFVELPVIRIAVRGTGIEASGVDFLRGDCNGDGVVTGSPTDAIFLLEWLFNGGPEPTCIAACDANGDANGSGGSAPDLSDAIYVLAFNFNGGPAPVAPFPDCGPLAEDEQLSCERAPEACEVP